MKRLFRMYRWDMPLRMVSLMESVSYDQNKFLDEVCKFHDLSQKKAPQKNRKNKLLLLISYYVWIVYIVLALLILPYNVLIALVLLLFGPFLVAGTLYIFVYSMDIVGKLR